MSNISNDVPAVLAAYSLPEVIRVTRITVGLIHETYKLDTRDASYILQKVRPMFANDAVSNDIAAVMTHLRSKGIEAQDFIPNTAGELLTWHHDAAWRVFTYLEGDVVSALDTHERAYQAGRMLGVFHHACRDIPHTFQATVFSHDTPKFITRLQEAVVAHQGTELYAPVADDAAYILERLPQLVLPGDVPRRVVHGDPKITNIIFKGDTAVAMIDLDTSNVSVTLHELGDALRSWCWGEEDDADGTFAVDRYEAALRGYEEGSQDLLTQAERALVPRALELITLELASRFLTDYFVDEYFGWDATRYPTRRAHNLARARGQIAEHKSFKM